MSLDWTAPFVTSQGANVRTASTDCADSLTSVGNERKSMYIVCIVNKSSTCRSSSIFFFISAAAVSPLRTRPHTETLSPRGSWQTFCQRFSALAARSGRVKGQGSGDDNMAAVDIFPRQRHGSERHKGEAFFFFFLSFFCFPPEGT